MTFELTILGSNSSIPAVNRNPSAQILNVNNRFFLIDCGEGTQLQLRKNHIKMQRIEHIYISHLHGDHYFGLVGLLSTMNLLGREKPLTIFGPAKLELILKVQLEAGENKLRFDTTFVAVPHSNGHVLWEDELLTVTTIKLRHRIPTTGFLFREKPAARKMRKPAIVEYQIPISKIPDIKRGADFETEAGEVIPNAALTIDPPEPRSFAYCSDTAYDESIVPHIKGVDLLYHEATFLNEKADRAKQTMHATAEEAATIAAKAEVGRLVLGHYSARYRDLDGFLRESRPIFQHTELGVEGQSYAVAVKQPVSR